MAFHLHVGPNIRKSPYFDTKVADGVRSFSVYNHMYIPGHFGDPEAEYDRLINGVAMWDVAAQRQVEIAGPDAARLVQLLSTRDTSGMVAGQGRYTCLCDAEGLLINDPVLLKLSPERFWLWIADADIALWAAGLAAGLGLDVRVFEAETAPMAVQGPKAGEVVAALFGDWVAGLKHFGFRQTEQQGIPLILACSGWSKQGGYEVYLQDPARGGTLWDMFRSAGAPFDIGPGVPNDTERIEARLVSYGADMRRQSWSATPLEIGLGRLVDFDSPVEFMGRAALDRERTVGPVRRRCGVTLDGPPIRSNEHPLPLLQDGRRVGLVSEVTRSPRLVRNIGLALVETSLSEEASGLTVHHDCRVWPVTLAGLPFVGTG